MDTELLLKKAQDSLAGVALEFNTPEAGRLDAFLSVDRLLEGVQIMVGAGGWHLSAMTGMDIPQNETTEGAIEVLYHFCQGPAVVTLRVQAPYGLPEIPSICSILPSATLYERELIEMFGLIIEETPDRSRLLLPDDWPDWVYPLRKSFKGLE